MTQVVTVSATTAAYAAEAVKPSARVRGDGPADEAITLLSGRRTDDAVAAAPAPVAKTKGALSLALMLISAERRRPQETAAETLRRYLEYMQDEEGGDRQGNREDEAEDRQDVPVADEEQNTVEVAAMLDQFIQGV